MLYTRFSKSTITSKAPTCIPLIKDLFFYLYLKYVLKERPITLEKVIFGGASLVAQMIKNLPAVYETWVRSLGWEDPLEEPWQFTPVFLPVNPLGQRGLAGYSPRGLKEWDTTE